MATEPLVVQALHAFKGTHNDELCFKKGDKITVTQKEDGGWWEGTLGDKTGWFPTNYVKEIKDVSTPPLSPVAQQRQYRAVVLKDLIDSERAHVTELQGLVKTFLKPLEKSTILTGDEYRQLTGNITEVLETHQQLLELLEECENKPSHEQRVGKIFLGWAPRIKTVHQAYCSSHPRAVCILDLHKDDLATYMESCGAATPGLLVLTTGLSKPFRRLDKYSGMLQELERHVEVNHPDRGDTQRSVSVYKDIAATCAATRRQKELELQVLTGPVRGWEGQSLAQLGDILHMGSVAVGAQHQDRYLVLFPNTLLVLSVSQRMSAFIYEGKLPLTGITVVKLEDTETYKNAFEISGPFIEKIVAICQSKEEANHWVDLLRLHTKGHHKTPPPASGGDSAPTPPPHLDYHGSHKSFRYSLPPAHYPSAAPYATLTKSFYRLVKEKVITQRLLKRLLYPEYMLTQVDLSVVVRRKHRTQCSIRTSGQKGANSSDGESDSSDEEDGNEDSNQLTRQNAIVRYSSGSSDDESNAESTDSNPFGFIRYYNSKPNKSSTEIESYESFIDHGENIEQPKILEPEEIPPEEEPDTLKPNHNLVVIQQISQESNSSFDCNSKPYLGCEDLPNLDETIKIPTAGVLGSRNYVPKMRQSLPTKFVANKFNKSSLTLVYIPQWQSSSESNLATRNSDSTSSSSETTTHSSCLDLPANPLPVPDAIVAEILYNPETLSDLNADEPAAPPNISSTHSELVLPDVNPRISAQRKELATSSRTCSQRKELSSDTQFDKPMVPPRISKQRKDISPDEHLEKPEVPPRISKQRKDLPRNGGNVAVAPRVSSQWKHLSSDAHPQKTDIPVRKSTQRREELLSCANPHEPETMATASSQRNAFMSTMLSNPFLEHSESVESNQTVVSPKPILSPPIMFKNEPASHFDFEQKRMKDFRKTRDILKSDDLTQTDHWPLCSYSQSGDYAPGCGRDFTYSTVSEPRVSLQKSNIMFRKHSINSDKPKRRSSMDESSFSLADEPHSPVPFIKLSTKVKSGHGNGAAPGSSRDDDPRTLRGQNTNSLRKCVSYQYLQLSNPSPSCSYGQYCRCCTEPCCSRRSSDSGMAGSCTLHSPDLAIGPYPNDDHYSLSDLPNLYDNFTDYRDVISLTEIEARDFEEQCRCTSPFGSTPRTSCQASTSDNILVGANRESTTSVTSATTSSSETGAFPPPQPWESENQIYEKWMAMRDKKKAARLDKQQQWNASTGSKSRSCDNFSVAPAPETHEVFRSGLYAHWWLKAKLPRDVVRGILEEATAAGKVPSSQVRAIQNASNSRAAGGSLGAAATLNNNGGWSASCLRPSAPLRPCLALGASPQASPARANRRLLSNHEDAQILKVIEAYCNSARPKNPITTGDFGLQGDRKFNEASNGKTLVENVKILQNEIHELQQNIGVLMVQLTEEKIARCTLQEIVKTQLLANAKEVDSIVWPQVDI